MTNRLAPTTWKNKATQSAWRAASWPLLGLMLLMALAGCANRPSLPGATVNTSATTAKNSTVKGTAKFVERTVLPANSIFEATLERLHERPVEAIEKQREPHIILQSASRRVTGSGSCNQLLLGYALERSAFRFTEGVVTARTCDTGMRQESTFLAALAAVTSFNMEARTLRLLNAQGRVIARFRADEI